MTLSVFQLKFLELYEVFQEGRIEILGLNKWLKIIAFIFL